MREHPYEKYLSKEDQLQATVAKYLNWRYPNILWTHVPNEGKRTAFEQYKLKKFGVLSGVSDILIFEPNSRFNGLCLELKVGKNKPTEKQKDFLEKMEKRGWMCFVIYSAEEAIVKIDSYFSFSKRGETAGEINPN